MRFADLGLAEAILRAVNSEGYVTATPVQAQAIPHGLQGRDVLGCAQTGTGKTAAFALPILQRLSAAGTPAEAGAPRGQGSGARARCLVLCPTRELATQIQDSFRTYGKHLHLRSCVIFGGVNQNPQVQALRRGVDIVIATPGRLLDLMNQGFVDLRAIEVLVLDEADRMLDMGFINDIRRVVAKLPGKRQTMMFSATMPREIRTLADALLRNPAAVQVAPVASTLDTIEQSVYFVQKSNKPELLAHLYHELPIARAIVFTRTKHGADRVVRHLHSRGIQAEAIHGNKSQNARERALSNFKANKTPILVATDIASRGIDVDGITHVVNYDLTHEPETYVHRIGRTGRAGASGAAVSFCDNEEKPNLKAIEKLIRRQIPICDNHPKYGTAPRSEQHRTDRPRSQQHHSDRSRSEQHRSEQPRQSASQSRHPQGAGAGAGARMGSARMGHPLARSANQKARQPYHASARHAPESHQSGRTGGRRFM